jgi:putative zinc finger protein
VNDDTADLDRLFARLSDEGHTQDPDDHPTPEKLSAYQAKELSPEEDDAIQEHLAQCTLCTELLLDLQRFLEPPAEDLPREGVVDFETAAEWRELRRRMGTTQATEVKREFPRKVFRMPAVAAVLALLLGGAVYRLVRLEGELTRPVAVQIKTIEAQGSKKGAPSAAEATPFRLGNVAVFETHSETPYPKYRLEFKDKNGQIRKAVDTQEDENGMIALLLPNRFLTPGLYHVEVLGLEGVPSKLIREFDIRILQ